MFFANLFGLLIQDVLLVNLCDCVSDFAFQVLINIGEFLFVYFIDVPKLFVVVVGYT